MAEVQIRVRQTVEGSEQVAGVQQNLGKLLSGVLKFAAVAGTVSYAAKQMFDMGEAGASINQLTESFERLNASVIQSPELMGKLKEASRGTLTEVELMQGVLKLVAGTSEELTRNLANASPQLLEIAKAAQKLNPQLGDTAFLYDSITTGIKRSSPLILDNLGIIVKVGEANENFAESLGKTVAQLSAEEKQMALLNAVLESGNNLIEQVGGNVDSQTDNWQRMRTAISEAGDAFKSGFAEGMADMDWDEANSGLMEMVEGFNTMGLILADTVDFLNFIGKWTPPSILSRLTGKAIEPFKEGGALHGPFVSESERAQQAALELGQEVEHADQVLSNYGTAARLAAEANMELAASSGDVQVELDLANRQADEFTELMDKYRRGIGIRRVPIDVDTEPAESKINALIAEHHERKITLQLGAGIDPGLQGVIDMLNQELVETDQRARLNVDAELDEKQIRQSFLNARASMSSGDYTLPVEPDVDQQPIETFLETAREAGGALDAIKQGSPYTAEVDGNLEQTHGTLAAMERIINSISGTHKINFVTTGSPGASGGGQGRAHGGPVAAGVPYIVGEAGPELFVPGMNGGIVPNSMLASAPAGGMNGGNNNNVEININGVSDPERAADAVVRKLQDRGMISRAALR